MFEKEAEEYRKDLKSRFFLSEPQLDLACQGFKDGYNKANELHDLRKDPNDLPKDNDEKLCFYKKGKVVARYDSGYSCWVTYFNNFETVIASSVIIAWCEIPTFTDKE